MKKPLLFFFFIFSFTFCKVHPTCAQTNLVPNPSFEQYSNCPHLYCGISYATGWHSAGGTPDYFNSCDSPSGPFEYRTPQNSLGYQYPASGNAYVGIGTYTLGFAREYLSAELITPIETDKKYFVSFKISLADRLLYCANNKMGVLFSTVSYNLGNDSCNHVPGLLPQNFAHVYSTSIITDTANWTTISGSFIADSTYQYIIIGNHFDDNNTDTMYCDPNAGGYYFIDDIYVSTDSITGIVKSNIEQSLAVYPTVTSDILFVQINTTAKTSIKIYDLLGKLIVSQNIVPLTQNSISLSEYGAGIYIVSVNIDSTVITKKIIVTK